MCGIFGMINCGDETILKNSLENMSHRGPDDEGTVWFKDKNTGLGHKRLSIIDLSHSGHQPMTTKYKRFWIIYNGEIFNYKELRNNLINQGIKLFSDSDTEIILNYFILEQEKCLDRLNGMFAFAIYDSENGNVFIARDRLGIKPLYYYHSGNRLIFASEIKSILNTGIYEKETDYSAIFTPVHYQITPKTGFKNIFKLPAGCYLKYENENISISKYWDIFPSEYDISENTATEELDNLLNDSVRLQMVSDVPVGVLLSGGLDSSIIAALMKKQSTNSVNSFTIKFDKKDLKQQGNVDDSYYAGIVADKFGFNHKEIILRPDVVNLLPRMVWHLDEPISDPSAINTYLISKSAKESGISVLLSGMGGDEVFGGYRSYYACLLAQKYEKLPGFGKQIIKKIMNKIPQASSKRNFKYVRWAKGFSRFAFLPDFERYLSSGNSALNEDNFKDYFNNSGFEFKESYYYNKQRENYYSFELSYLTKMCLLDTKGYMTDHNLNYSDKASMAACVECRPPLIDHRIVEFMFKLKPDYRIRKKEQKYILKKVAEKYLPKKIIYRPKAPFSAPMRGWLKNELKEMVNDTLSYDAVKKRGLLNPDYMQKLIQDNNSGLNDNSQLIFRALTTELWFNTFIDK